MWNVRFVLGGDNCGLTRGASPTEEAKTDGTDGHGRREGF